VGFSLYLPPVRHLYPGYWPSRIDEAKEKARHQTTGDGRDRM